ncbi:hypothetical protein LTR86_003979 [Recurvomyces mirabilis]|nr:hypothetical protein LTR86_003979 [Recurvomyces mirabilis]
MAPKLEKALTIRGYLLMEDVLQLGQTKGGAQRIIVPLSTGFIRGPDFEAKVLPSGSDWLSLDSTSGFGHLDVRINARSEEGDMIYAHYTGIIKMDAVTQKILAGEPGVKTTKPEDHYFVSTPVFEVSSERLKWMEQSVFVSHGHFHIDDDGKPAVAWDVYKVVSQ